MDTNGVYRVQTTRIESLEVSKQIMATPAIDVATNANVSYALSKFTETTDGVKISVVETSRRNEPETFVEPSKIRPISDTKQLVKTKITPKAECSGSGLSDISTTIPLEKESTQNEIGSIDSNTFMESLNLKSNHGESKEHKNIDNFSVIKKYAKKKRQKQQQTHFTLEELEFDEEGNMIKMEKLPWNTELDSSD